MNQHNDHWYRRGHGFESSTGLNLFHTFIATDCNTIVCIKYHATDIELLCCSSIKVTKQGFLKKNIIQNLDIYTSREQKARAIKTQGNLRELWSRRWDKGDFKRWNWEVRRKRSRLKGFSCGIIWVYIMMKKIKWCLSTFFFSYSSSCSHSEP